MPACGAVRKTVRTRRRERATTLKRLNDQGKHMTDEQTRTSDSGRNFAIAVILACYLIGTFLWNVLIPAHE